MLTELKKPRIARSPHAILRYGMAVLSVTAAVSSLWLMNTHWKAAAPVSVFLLAVIISTWFGGAKPGLFAIVLSTLAFGVFFLPSIPLLASGPTHLPRLVLFTVVASFVVWVIAAERNARRALDQSARALQAENSERQRVQAALQESAAKLKEAQRLAQIGYWESDLLADRITLSEETCRLLGLEQQRVLSQAELQEMIHPADREFERRAFNEMLQVGRPYDAEYRIIRPDGELRFIHAWDEIAYDESARPVRMFGTVQDITERKRVEAQLQRSNEELHALAARLQSVREEESSRIAREIHDELGAGLSGLHWDLEELAEVIAECTDLSQLAALRQKTETLIGQTETIIEVVRRLASELRPVALDELGLSEAIQWHAQEFQARTGIVVNCDCQLEDPALDQVRATALFRIFQEALTNILRHAQATRVDVIMAEEAGELVLTIGDNGRGIREEEQAGQHSLGLLGMRERAHLIEARIDITGVPGKGTVITVRAPVAGASDGGTVRDGPAPHHN